MTDENTDRKTFYYGKRISVEIPSTMHSSGVRVYFSNFSVPHGTELSVEENNVIKTLHGIANVGFIFPEGVDDDGVNLRVYLTEDEKKIYTTIYALKPVPDGGPKWELIGEGVETEEENESAYILAKIPGKDPPIAVG